MFLVLQVWTDFVRGRIKKFAVHEVKAEGLGTSIFGKAYYTVTPGRTLESLRLPVLITFVIFTSIARRGCDIVFSLDEMLFLLHDFVCQGLEHGCSKGWVHACNELDVLEVQAVGLGGARRSDANMVSAQKLLKAKNVPGFLLPSGAPISFLPLKYTTNTSTKHNNTPSDTPPPLCIYLQVTTHTLSSLLLVYDLHHTAPGLRMSTVLTSPNAPT